MTSHPYNLETTLPRKVDICEKNLLTKIYMNMIISRHFLKHRFIVFTEF